MQRTSDLMLPASITYNANSLMSVYLCINLVGAPAYLAEHDEQGLGGFIA